MNPFERIADYTAQLDLPASVEVFFLAGFAITLFGFDYIRQHWKSEPVIGRLAQQRTTLPTDRGDQTFKRIAPCMLFSIAATLTVIFLEQASAALTAAPDHATAVETNGLAAWVARALSWLSEWIQRRIRRRSPAAYAATAASSRMSRVLLVSTRTPGPIVEVIVIVRRYLPLVELGLARMISSIRAA